MGTQPTYDVYIACDSLDLDWEKKDVVKFDQMWNEGYSLELISEKLNRDIDEVAVLVIDRCRKRKIAPRSSGIFQMVKR